MIEPVNWGALMPIPEGYDRITFWRGLAIASKTDAPPVVMDLSEADRKWRKLNTMEASQCLSTD